MRISTSTYFNQAKNELQKRRGDVSQLQAQISSGKRVEQLGDDRLATKSILQDQSSLRANASALRISADLGRVLNFTEHTLGTATSIMQRTRELTVQMANDTYGFEERQAAIIEISHLKEEMLAIANTEFNGRTLFSGDGNVDPAFDATGAFLGDGGQLEVPIGKLRFNASLPGGEPFEDPTGGPSIFQTFDDVITAIGSSDGALISATLDDIDVAFDRISNARTEIGRTQRQLDVTIGTLDHFRIMTAEALSAERDTDMIEAIMQLREAESGLKAAMVVTTRLEGMSLVDML